MRYGRSRQNLSQITTKCPPMASIVCVTLNAIIIEACALVARVSGWHIHTRTWAS